MFFVALHLSIPTAVLLYWNTGELFGAVNEIFCFERCITELHPPQAKNQYDIIAGLNSKLQYAHRIRHLTLAYSFGSIVWMFIIIWHSLHSFRLQFDNFFRFLLLLLPVNLYMFSISHWLQLVLCISIAGFFFRQLFFLPCSLFLYFAWVGSSQLKNQNENCMISILKSFCWSTHYVYTILKPFETCYYLFIAHLIFRHKKNWEWEANARIERINRKKETKTE